MIIVGCPPWLYITLPWATAAAAADNRVVTIDVLPGSA
jgi:hypothetical protein